MLESPARRGPEIVNAGHNPGFVITPDGVQHQIEAAGTPLGLLPGMTYASERINFTKGSRLLFYTDGLTEVFLEDEEFGQDRLLDQFSRTPTGNADGILDALWLTVHGFPAGDRRKDDARAALVFIAIYCAVQQRSLASRAAGRGLRMTASAIARATTVEVRLPSRLGFEKVAMSTAASVAKLMGFREERIDDLKTAIAEACAQHAIEHGNRLK